MIPGSPDIDTFVDVTAVFSDALLQISGEVRGDDFPNAEVFIYDGTGASRLLFHFETSRGRNTGPMTGLWGANADQVLGRFAELIPLHPDGAFRIMVDHARARVPVRTSADAARTPVDWGPRPRVPIAAGSN